MYSLPNPNYLGIMMPDFLLVYNIAPSTYTFLLKVKSKEGLWVFIHGKSRFSGLKNTIPHIHTHTLMHSRRISSVLQSSGPIWVPNGS